MRGSLLGSEIRAQSQLECPTLRIIRGDIGGLLDFALVPGGVFDLEGDAAFFARRYDFVKVSRSAATARFDILDLQVGLAVIANFESVSHRRSPFDIPAQI